MQQILDWHISSFIDIKYCLSLSDKFKSCVCYFSTGCVKKDESSEEWLMKNFGSFSAMARMKDFSNLNMVFSGVSNLEFSFKGQRAKMK